VSWYITSREVVEVPVSIYMISAPLTEPETALKTTLSDVNAASAETTFVVRLGEVDVIEPLGTSLKYWCESEYEYGVPPEITTRLTFTLFAVRSVVVPPLKTACLYFG